MAVISKLKRQQHHLEYDPEAFQILHTALVRHEEALDTVTRVLASEFDELQRSHAPDGDYSPLVTKYEKLVLLLNKFSRSIEALQR